MNFSLQLAQSRHILALMGINYWVDRSCQPHFVPKLDDGFGNPRIQHLIPKNLASHHSATPSVLPTDHQKPLVSDVPTSTVKVTALPNAPSIAPKTPPKTPNAPKSSSDLAPSVMPKPATNTKKADVPFYLQGVRYGRWVLVVDLLGLDDELVMIWQSLKQALINHAKQHAISHHSHEAHYPMINVDNDYVEHKHLMPADGVFWGFLFGLGMDKDSQVAYLTALPDTLPNATDGQSKLPLLDELAKEPTLKKQLWATITQNP